jgi:Domain of unknown function (DUF4132)
MGLLRRLVSPKAGLTGEQASLLERHRDRAEALVEEVLEAAPEFERLRLDSPAGERLLAQPPEAIVSATIVAFVGSATPNISHDLRWMLRRELATSLVRRKLPWTLEDVELLFAVAFNAARGSTFDWVLFEQLGPAVSAADRYARDHGVEALRPLLEEALGAVKRIDRRGWEAEATRLRTRIHKLLEQAGGPGLDLSLVQPDDWGKAVQRRLKGLEHAGPLLAHLSRATSARPSGTWQKRTSSLLQGNEDVVRLLLDEAATCEVRLVREYEFDGERFAEYHWLSDGNANLVRGALWALPVLRPAWAQELLERLIVRGLAHSTKVANACVYALGELATPEAVGLLSALHSEVKDRGFQKQVQKALDAAAAALNVSPTRLLERVVPTHGLDSRGRREIPVGSWRAVLEVEPARVTTRWVGPDGEEQKTTPAAVKEAPELREVKAAAKELRTALATERARLESLLADDPVWSLDEWHSAYREHPLVGVLARGLFWRFDDEIALGEGAPARASEVRLWHPALAAPDEVQGLRRSLLERELAQPFKQAYREVYLVAPAELETRVYSNRFAAHVLHYPQTYALLKERGWGGSALGPWDGGYETAVFREFRVHGLRAEWWLESADAGDSTGGTLANLATTDQVRFVSLEQRDREPIPLADVPSLVFSEAMRDVDLFVGVSSIGADPTWGDRGIDRFDTYWNVFSFGELDQAAQVRRDVLAELIPKLRIADQLELEDRFVRVRGDLGTYKIHLRSGNILMEPNDQYLCIVPVPAAERPTTKVFLPFEDDRRLNVILSKAFLLANDRKIKDRTILAQLSRV